MKELNKEQINSVSVPALLLKALTLMVLIFSGSSLIHYPLQTYLLIHLIEVADYSYL